MLNSHTLSDEQQHYQLDCPSNEALVISPYFSGDARHSESPWLFAMASVVDCTVSELLELRELTVYSQFW